MSDWRVTSNLVDFNRALDRYVNKFQVNACTIVRQSALKIMGQIASDSPVLTGRSRAAWLPFLISEDAEVDVKSSGLNTPEAGAARREGLRLGKYKKEIKDTPKPFVWVQNRVPYTVYLEYGVRKGSQRGKKKSSAKFSPVAKSGTVGFVKKAVDDEKKDFLEAIRGNVKKAGKK